MHKLAQLLVLFCLIFNFNLLKAQGTRLDSLEHCLKTHLTDDTLKVKLLNEIVWNSYKIDAGKAYDRANEAIEICKKINFSKGEAESLYLIGTSIAYHQSDKLALDYFLKSLKIAEAINYRKGMAQYLLAGGRSYASIGNISEATECYLRARKIGEELNDLSLITRSMGNLSMIYTGKGDYRKALDGYQEILRLLEKEDNKKIRSGILNNMGEINKYQGNYPQALESYHMALKLKEEENNESGICLSYLNIGSIYTLQGDYEKALDYEQRALKIADKLNNKRLISSCYEEIGNVYLQTHQPEALAYYKRALTIAEQLSYQTPKIRILSKIGDYYRAQGDYNEALVNYTVALKISEELSRKRTICETSTKIGGIYLLQKEYAKALEYSQKCVPLANELNLLDNQKDLHKQLSEIYYATKDYKNAYLHHKLYTEINDRVYNEKNVKKIAELEYAHKFEKEKQAIELEQKKKDALQSSILISLFVGFLLVSFFAIYIYQSLRLKHKTNLILVGQKHQIEELNQEYQVVNNELRITNKALVATKKKVEESEEKLKLLIKNSNDIIVLVNEKGEQSFISDVAKNLTGYDVNDLLGAIEDVIFPEDLEIVRKHWDRVLENKEMADCIQYRHKHKEKGYVWFEAVAQNYLDNPSIHAVVANVRDITERKNAELALKKSEAVKAQLLTNEIERINRELELNQKSITAATLKLIQNSERDLQTIERLSDLECHTNPEGKQKINTLIADLKRLSYTSNWNEFEILFEKVHSSFYQNLHSQFPTLTANERKICAFLKLNMSNKDIAQITFQSDEALKKARMRLRQKLNIDRETNLVAFLQNI